MLSNSKSNSHYFERERLKTLINLIPVLMILCVTLVNWVLKTNHTIAVFFFIYKVDHNNKLKHYSFKKQQIIILRFWKSEIKNGSQWANTEILVGLHSFGVLWGESVSLLSPSLPPLFFSLLLPPTLNSKWTRVLLTCCHFDINPSASHFYIWVCL